MAGMLAMSRARGAAQRLLCLDAGTGQWTIAVKLSWLESGDVHGDRKIHADLHDARLACGFNGMHRLMNHSDQGSGRVSSILDVERENTLLLRLITCKVSSILSNPEGLGSPISELMKDGCIWPFLLLCFIHWIIDWSIPSRIAKALVLNLLLMWYDDINRAPLY